ncbi:PEP-CTERM sorting domain-containing protein [Oleiharenicola lentus]|uniref:PEP-CTERM sorting domain-containing protein n=1 Tax=Oleiharenicola lentus TaxID=2508720 RepID=UPI003F676ECB
MKKTAFTLLFLGVAASAFAQTLLIDDFNVSVTSGEGTVNASSSWAGQVTQGATTIVIGGTAKDDNGFEYFPASFLNLSAFNQITVVGQRDVGNVATSFALSFDSFDGENFTTQVVSVAMSAFNIGSLTTVNIPVAWTIDATNIAYVSFGGGSIGSAAFRMTLDNLAATTSVSAIPEPSTYAAIFGAMALGLVAYRRRQARLAA